MKLADSEIQLLKKYNYYSKVQEKYETWWNRKEYWRDIQTKDTLSDAFILQFSKYLDFALISSTQKLSETVIEKSIFKVDWHDICMCQDLSEDFIERYNNAVDWDMISYYQVLSKEFLLKHRWELNWCNVFRNEKIDESIKKALIESMN